METQRRYLFRLILPAFPCFNIYSSIAKKTTSLGPILVATSANKLANWDVEVIDENNCRDRLCPKDKDGRPDHEKLQELRPADAVGFYGSLSSTMPRVYELAALYKQLGAMTVSGGKHVENLPVEALKNNIDVVVFGDGEEAIREILQAYENKKGFGGIFGIGFLREGQPVQTDPRPQPETFSHLPKPDFGLLRYAKMGTYPVSWWRGCPYNCEFCAVKGKTRCSPAETLFETIVHLVETRNAKKFFIVDDHFGGNPHKETDRQEAIRFCQMIIDYKKRTGRRFHFTAQIRLNAAKFPDLLSAMKEAGFFHVCIGYESPIDEELKAMQKGYTSKDMVEWTRIFHQYGFFVHGMFIFGYPKKPDDPKSLLSIAEKTQRFRDFIAKARIDTAQILLTVPLPGTALRERLAKENRIFPLEEVGWEYYDGQFPLYIPDDCTAEELMEAVKHIMGWFYQSNHLWRIIIHITIHFPALVFPTVFTLPTLRVRYMTGAFRLWYSKFFRNLSIRFAGSFIVKGWKKQFDESDFPKRMARAKVILANLKKA